MEKLLIRNFLLCKYTTSEEVNAWGCCVYYLYSNKSFFLYNRFESRMNGNNGFIFIGVPWPNKFIQIEPQLLDQYVDECFGVMEQINRMRDDDHPEGRILLCVAVADYFHEVEWIGFRVVNTPKFLESYRLLHRLIWLVTNRENALTSVESASSTRETDKCPPRVEAPPPEEVHDLRELPLSPTEFSLSYLDSIYQNVYAWFVAWWYKSSAGNELWCNSQ